jgi:hypothetical protein
MVVGILKVMGGRYTSGQAIFAESLSGSIFHICE